MSGRWAALVSALAVLACPAAALAQPSPGSPKAAYGATERAKPHFDNGVRLFQDGNFAGALAEFEVAYRIKPGASSLQNMALCLKALFRYSEAANALETLLERHGTELTDDARAKVRGAIGELNSLVGSVRLAVTPPEARVTIDGRVVDAKGGSVRLDVGEHVIVAEAPGFARRARSIRIAGGQSAVTVEIALAPVTGRLAVAAADGDAAIAVDGQAKAFGSWQGRLAPGRHYVQVYKRGYRQFESAFVLDAGETRRVEAPPLVQADTAPESPAPGSARPIEPPVQRGWYALGVVSVLPAPPRGAPANMEHDDRTDGSGASVGVRAGYRIWTPVSVEALVEGGPMKIQKACHQDCKNDVRRDYSIQSVRLGGNVRYMSSGEGVRFASTLGVGGVRHTVKLEETDAGVAAALPGGEAAGTDPYFLAELGAQLNLGHVLLEAGLLVFVEGTDNIRGDFDGQTDAHLYGQDGLVMGGLTLKGGWGEWSPTPAIEKRRRRRGHRR